jgi:hypothetical protein
VAVERSNKRFESAVLLHKPNPDVSLEADTQDNLVALFRDVKLEFAFTFELKGVFGSFGSETFYRFRTPEAKYTVKFTVQSSSSGGKQGLTAIGFDPGPRAQISAVDEKGKESKLEGAAAMVLRYSTLFLQVRPIEIPFEAINLPDYRINSVSPLGMPGWYLVRLSPDSPSK